MRQCSCEKEKESRKRCPFGVVTDDEDILLAGIHPLNVGENELLPSAFDDRKLKKEEQSVCRKKYTSKEEVVSKIVDPLVLKGKQKQPPQDRSFLGLFIANARAIRSLTVEESNVLAYCILDDPLEEEAFLSHAVICYSDAISSNQKFWEDATKKAGKSAKTAALSNLTELFNRGKISLEKAFP